MRTPHGATFFIIITPGVLIGALRYVPSMSKHLIGVVEARLRGALVHRELAVLARVAALARVVEIDHVVHTRRAFLAHSDDRVRLDNILQRPCFKM